MNRLRAVGAAGLAVLLAACTSSPGGSSTPGGSASATPALSAAPVEAVAPGEAVKTTSADVAGFDVAQHAVDTSKASPDRLAVTSAAMPPGFATPPPGAGRQRYLDQKISWTACGGFQCGTVLVPLDWDHPDGQAITLKMKKAPAAEKRAATLFVNPGGPGGSGQDMVTSMDPSDFPGHDVIGWDPRGSGQSTPVVCGSTQQTDEYFATDTSPDDEAEWTKTVDEVKSFAQQCRENSGALLDHISTVDNVRDLDYLRSLVGDPKLDYLGVSYGTYIGAMYGEMYPQRTGRMVLDSAVNITDDDTVIQAMGFELALKNYATWCATSKCGLGGTSEAVVKAVTTLFDQLDAKPLEVRGRQLTQSLGMTGAVTYLYMGAQGYPLLTNAIKRAQAGDGGVLMATSDLMNGRDARGNYGSMAFSFPGIACADASDDGVAAVRTELAADEKKAPILAKYFGPNLQCTYWTAKPAPQLKITAKGAAPIVVLGATGDPATPYQHAQSMAKQLSTGVLVTWKGAGHSAWELGNDCVKGSVRSWINEGTVPKAGLTC